MSQLKLSSPTESFSSNKINNLQNVQDSSEIINGGGGDHLVDEIKATCELQWSNLVHAEIISVTSAMRKNSRWSGMNVTGLNMGGLGINMGLRRVYVAEIGYRNQESPLLIGFSNLRSHLSTISGLNEIDAVVLLEPFLEVIKSGDTNGPITATALGSVEKFLTYGILNMNSPNLPQAMSMLSSAATHCKFEGSDSVSDEFVLLKILQVLRLSLTSEVGRVLSDEALCVMMETGLSMCCQMRLSEMLRRSAEHTMIVMVQNMFERLKSLEEKPSSLFSRENGDGENDSSQDLQVRMAPPDPKSPHLPLSMENITDPFNNISNNNTNTISISNNDDLVKLDRKGEEVVEDDEVESNYEILTTQEGRLSTALNEEEKESDPKPFGVPSIRELLRVLISLLNPHDHQHTDTMRLMALGILNVAFEVGGRTIGRFEVLRNLAVDELCKYLFQLARTDNMILLSLTIRVISTVFGTLRPYLKLQQELYLSFLIERLTPPSYSLRSLALNEAFSSTNTDNSLQLDPGIPISPNREQRNFKMSDVSYATGEIRELLLESLGQFARESSFMVDLWVNYDCNVDCGDLFEEVIKFLSKNSFPDSIGYSVSNSHTICFDALLMFVNHMIDRLQENVSNASSCELSWDQLTAADYNSGLKPKRKQQKQILREGAAKFNESPKAGLEFLKANRIIYSDNTVDENTSTAIFLKSTPRLNKIVLGDFLSKPSNFEILKAFVKLFNFQGRRIDEAMREMLESFRLPGEAQQIERIMETFAITYFATKPAEIASQDATFVLAYSVIMLNTDLHNPQVRRRMTIEDYMKNLRNVNNGQNFDTEYLHAIYDAIRKKEIIMPEEHEGQLGFNYAWKELLHRAESAGPFIICDVSLYDKDMYTTVWRPTVAAISYAPDDATLQKAINGFHQCALLSAQYKLYEVFDYIIMSLAKMTGLLGSRYSNETASNPIIKVQGIEITVSDLAIQFGRNYKGQLAAVVLFAVANEHGNVLRDGWKYILEIIKNLFVNSLLPSSMIQVEDFLAGTTTIPLKPKTTNTFPKQERRDNSLLSALSSYLLSPYSSNYESSRSAPTEEEIECTMCTVDCVKACHLDDIFADIRFALKFIADGNTTTKTSNNNNTTTTKLSYPPTPHTTYSQRQSPKSKSQNNSILLVERTVVALLRLCIRLTHKDEMVFDILLALELLATLPHDVINSVGEQMMAGILNIIKSDPSCIKGKRPWESVFKLLRATSTHPQASKYSFDVITFLIKEKKSINLDNFNDCVELLAEFASAATFPIDQQDQQFTELSNPKNLRANLTKTQSAIIDRAKEAVVLMNMLYMEIPNLLSETGKSPREAWSNYWLPILTGFSQQCYSPCLEVRQNAISCLQRSLLNPQLVSHGGTEWVLVFDLVLFPLLDQLLKPEIYQADPVGIDESRIRASALLCKIFLHYLNRLIEWGGLITLWSQVLDVMEKYMFTGDNDSLREAVPESLKNMLLVMLTSGVLIPPGSSSLKNGNNKLNEKASIEIWEITWIKINKFLPNLKIELNLN
ncbi:11413_t:CDS:10 [Entrophospora sp. SA101]|nr:11413_t:CDS:10 [Entrophospora sp. SA101]